jgi:7-cyano-7-deazaguanine synthase in queuosine biosynthesis
VALFSGGLDSLAGAIDRLESGERLVLVSHYDFGQLASGQQGLTQALQQYYGPDRLHHLDIRVQIPEAPELTLRSRSLLYLALGLAAAAAFRPDLPLLVPENGWISFNPPLTLNRLGSYSTRTTHPYFLQELAAIWQEAGLSHPLINPYQHQSKGEMLADCRNPKLLRELVPLTSSCARPVVGRWQGEAQGSCGYCYPCLMRRAALNRLGLDQGGHYRLDALQDQAILSHRQKGCDLRALLLALKTWAETPHQVEARLWLGVPPSEVPLRYYPAKRLLTNGFQEIAQLFQDKGPPWIRDYVDWS